LWLIGLGLTSWLNDHRELVSLVTSLRPQQTATNQVESQSVVGDKNNHAGLGAAAVTDHYTNTGVGPRSASGQEYSVRFFGPPCIFTGRSAQRDKHRAFKHIIIES